MPLLSLVLLMEGIWQISGDRTVQPCGPKLCEALCQSNKDCTSKIFDEIQLSCKLIVKTHDLNRRCVVSHEGAVMQNKNTSYPKKAGHNCSRVHMVRFYKACSKKNLQTLEKLVGQRLLDVNCRNKKGFPLVMIVTLYNWTRAFDYLVQQNCDLTLTTQDLYNVLHCASTHSEGIVRKLLGDHCSDIDIPDLHGQTPLHHAVQERHVRIAQLLIDRGADVNAVDKYNKTILYTACQFGNLNMVKYILSLNVIDIDRRGEKGRTPLLIAVVTGNLPLVKLLLQHKADVTKLEENECNVLHLAAATGHFDMVKFLVSLEELSGFEKRKTKFGQTPAQIAATFGKSEIALFLKSRLHFQ